MARTIVSKTIDPGSNPGWPAKCPDEHDECSDCNICRKSFHKFTHEPYCDWCGKPYDLWFDRIKDMAK